MHINFTSMTWKISFDEWMKKMTSRCQFHQRFFARFFRTNVLFGSFSNYVLALAPKFRTKNARVNVDEIDYSPQKPWSFTWGRRGICELAAKFTSNQNLMYRSPSLSTGVVSSKYTVNIKGVLFFAFYGLFWPLKST